MLTFQIQEGILDAESLHSCLDVLRAGGILCYPTETFYAFGIDLWNERALHDLYSLKQRPPEKELPLIASDIAMVASICDTGDSRFAPLARKFWPGPLTLILPGLDRSKTFAIRVSSHRVAQQLAEAFGSPVVSTSANRSGQAPLSQPQFLAEDMKQKLAILIDAGVSPGGAPSTIVSLMEQPGKILREGAIPASEIVSLL